MDGQPMRQRQQSRHSTLHFMVLWRRHTTDAGDDDLLMYVQSSPAQTIVAPVPGLDTQCFTLRSRFSMSQMSSARL